MATLYELTTDYYRLLELAEDPDTDPEALADTMEAIGGEFEDKAQGYACVIRQMEFDATAIDAEIKRLQNRKRSMEANAQRLKDALRNAMQVTGKTKFKTALFSFSFRRSDAVVIDDESRVSHDYLIPQPPKVDKKAIRDMLKEGFCFDWAHLEERENLQIR